MTTIETLKQMSIQHSKSESETDALDEAIKALENQPKYEKALKLMGTYNRPKTVNGIIQQIKQVKNIVEMD